MKPYAIPLDNGAILIEWIAENRRFSIHIDKDVELSSWSYVSRDLEENGCGRLPPELIELLRKGLM